MGGRSSSSGLTRSTNIARPLAETWKDSIPENATIAQRNTLNSLWNYGSTQYEYLNLEYTDFRISTVEGPQYTDEERRLLGVRKQAPTLMVSFELQRKDREDNVYLNMLDTNYETVMIGPRGGMYVYDGNGRREDVTLLSATSRIARQDREERDRRQRERRNRRNG